MIALLSALARRSVTRRLELPPGVDVFGVGGATRGGSGRTPLSIAIVSALVSRGIETALVGHAYRARPMRPLRVSPNDPVDRVGDEALLAARTLNEIAPVFVAPTRHAAIAFASRTHRTIVVDRLLQTVPIPLARSVLAIDGGDPAARFVDVADEVVRIGGPDARRVLVGGAVDGNLLSPAEIARHRVGLITTIARPHRVLQTLAQHGIVPRIHRAGRDHVPFGRWSLDRLSGLARREALDFWLADAKSAIALPARIGVPVARLRDEIVLSSSLVDRLANACRRC